MKKNKSLYPTIIFLGIILSLLVIAYIFRDYLPELKPLKEEKEENKSLGDCISKKNITLYGFKDSKITQEQINEIKELFNYINFVDCSENKEKCQNILLTPAWKIEENIYYNYFSRGTLIKIGECDGL
ncbi:MAG: hypothetical protein QXX68_02225 [Candidatus Pacearchaeota archaeon]